MESAGPMRITQPIALLSGNAMRFVASMISRILHIYEDINHGDPCIAVLVCDCMEVGLSGHTVVFRAGLAEPKHGSHVSRPALPGRQQRGHRVRQHSLLA